MRDRLRTLLQMLWWDWGLGWPAILLAAAAIGLLAWAYTDTYRVIARSTTEIVGYSNLMRDDGYGGLFLIALPDGARVHVQTRNPHQAARLRDTACVEKRRHRSGRITYALSMVQPCPEEID